MQKEQGYKVTKNSIALTAFSALIVLIISTNLALAEETAQLELEVHYTNGDISDYNSMKFLVYQDFDKTPFLTVDATGNPTTIQVAKNHDYKIEVYVNDIYASVDYIEINEQSEKLNINIPLSAGLKIKVYYEDGLTPIDDATVVIKSNGNTELRRTITNDNGETQRFWIQSTTKLDEYYVADVYLSDVFLLSESQIRLQPGQQLDHKITANIPKIIQELFTISIYKNSVNKISNSDGNYEVTITNTNSGDSLTSDVNFRGEAHFSNIKPGLYTTTVTSNDPNESKYWNEVNLEILGDVTNFNLFRTEILETEPVKEELIEVGPADTESEFTDCNCVVFRLDDVQDYWLADTQVKIIELFSEKQVPLTIGVIGSLIGEDQKISSVIEENLESENIELANHSWNNDIVTTLDENIEEKYILDTNAKIIEEFGVLPTTFIPPQNIYDESTIEILKNNGFTVLSSHKEEISTLSFGTESFYVIPAITETARLVNNDSEWQLVENTEILTKIQNSIATNGYAIVMMHPQEFSLNEQGEYDVPNQESLDNLGVLLDKIQELDVNLLTINQINRGTISEEIEESCDCIAFRLDDVQDYWLNDVQIDIMKKFNESNTPLTIGIIANAFGNDEKITTYVRENTNNLEIASRGTDLNPITGHTKEKQSEIISESILKIKNDVGVEPKTFIPPGNKFNSDTLVALKENGITHLSASLINGDSPPFPLRDAELYRFPQITSTGVYNVESSLFESQKSEKILDEMELSIENFGFGVITMTLQEFANVEEGVYINSANEEKLDKLSSLISKIKEKGFDVVTINNINIDSPANVPSWIKNNAGWWADGAIDDETFVQGIEYLIKENIIKVAEKTSSGETASTVPAWIKNNAGWWADGAIDDETFVQGIEYLVKTGIISY